MKLFSILERYLVVSVYRTFIGVTLVLTLILFANNFVFAMEKIINGEYASDALLQLMGFQLLEMLSFLIPPAFFFAILMSLGRLYRDSEIIAMQSSGVGNLLLYRAYLVGAIPVVLLVTFLVMVSLPWANQSLAQLQANQDRDNTTYASIEVGRFQEMQNGETVFFAASHGKDSSELRDVFIKNTRNGRQGIISAHEAYQLIDDDTGQHYLVLRNGFRYVGEPGQNNYTISRFYEYALRIREVETRQAVLAPKALPTAQLWASDEPLHQFEMQFRYSIPMAVVALTFLAIPLSRSMPRQGIYGRMLTAFVVYFTFMNVHKLAEKWMERGDSPLWLGMWWVPVVAIAVALLIESGDRYAYLLSPARLISRLRSS